MKLNRLNWPPRDEWEDVAGFGEARLIKKLDGTFQLIGGTPEDRRQAREWCSRFMRKAVRACDG